jgi:putative hydroxymethylpyrimidine transport system ATP-binding protein
VKILPQQVIGCSDHLIDLGTFCHSDRIIWDNLQFELSKTGWTGFLGKSGIGKTTLLRCLAGLEVAQPLPLKDHKVALLAQNGNLLPWTTVLKNVVIGGILRGEKPNEKQALNLLIQVGLGAYADYYPMQLSMGMRQRVALARTLYEQADLILLDEPFTALDTKIKYELYELTQTLLAEKMVVIVTHDPLEALTLCERIYLFKGLPTTLVPFELSQSPQKAPLSVARIGNSPDLNRLMETILCD